MMVPDGAKFLMGKISRCQCAQCDYKIERLLYNYVPLVRALELMHLKLIFCKSFLFLK